MNRDPDRCDYCREPFIDKTRFLYMLDKTKTFTEPLFNVHLYCAYELLDDLKEGIQKIESGMG
jgi:hypothetical protein